MKIKISIVYLLLLLGYSCNNNRNDDRVKTKNERNVDRGISMNEPSRPMSELVYLVFEKGDTNAYYELKIAYLDYEHGEFFKFAKVMADKYDYTQAYFDVYFQTLKSTQREGTTLSLDSCTLEERNLAIKYLRMAEKKGHHQAKDEIEELRKEGFIK